MKTVVLHLAKFFVTIAVNMESGIPWDTGVTMLQKISVLLIVLIIFCLGGFCGLAYCNVQQKRSALDS
jgi:hypothetical protein